MKKKYKAFALFSGGLDSVLSVLYMKKLGYEILPIFFKTPFWETDKAKKAAEDAGFELIICDITEKYLQMLLHPKYGYGKNMNPCIDCHGLMFNTAANLMEKLNVDFIISGEVIGQRPMSQRKDAMNSVAKLSQVKDLLVRPMCQKLLRDTLPIRESWVKKEEMLDIQGRNRQRQLKMAQEYGIITFQNPGGGCLLTDEKFSNRLKDLIVYNMYKLNFIELLKVGRHFRLNDGVKLIVGRNDRENVILDKLADNNLFLQTNNVAGPLALINSNREVREDEIRLASSILLRYNNKIDNIAEVKIGKKTIIYKKIDVEKMSSEQVKKYQL